MMALMVNEPKPGQESYAQYNKEKADLLASLRRRAHLMTDAFNSLEGVTCQFTEGAMYSFPRVRLPPKAMQVRRARQGAAARALWIVELSNRPSAVWRRR